MLLSIYDLDDSSGKPLCSFGQGEHVIGRGGPLKCSDKRISRKHALIEVSQNAATITAKHEINPCFYRAAEGKHISILKYDLPVELSSGDKFGFFPDKHWFQIKITTNTNDLQNNRTSLGVDENLNESHVSAKSDVNSRNQEASIINNSNINEDESIHNENNVEEAIPSNVGGVEIKVEEVIEEDVTSNINESNCETNEENVDESNRETNEENVNEINCETNEENVNESNCETNEENVNETNKDDSALNTDDAATNVQRDAEDSILNVNDTESSIQRGEELSVNVNSERRDSALNGDETSAEKNCDLVLNTNNGERSAESNETDLIANVDNMETDLLLNPNNVEDTLETDDGDLSLNRLRSIYSADTTMAEDESVPDISEDLQHAAENIQTANASNSSEPNLANVRIKQEPDDGSNVRVKLEVIDDDQDDDEVAPNVASPSSAVDANEDEDEVAPNVASTSSAVDANTQKVYRDRCWYGATCYRKNDEHRLKFSHPNDNDYDTDPDDPRPSCSYGGDCYRRNKDHRQNFKHSRKKHANPQPPPGPSSKKKRSPKTRKRKGKTSTNKDNDGDDGDGLSQSNIVRTKRRRNNKPLVDSPLDDYDLNDPFLDDSGDEFHMDSDASESEDDSQSQNN